VAASREHDILSVLTGSSGQGSLAVEPVLRNVISTSVWGAADGGRNGGLKDGLF